MITLDSVSTAGIQKCRCSHYIGADICLRIRDGTVYVALCCKIDNHIRLFFFKQLEYKITVCNIAMYKFIIRFVLYRFQSLQVSCIGQKIQVDDLILRVFIYHMMYKVSADESCSACHDNFHYFT